MKHRNIKCDEKKVKALYIHILEECERQSFSIAEFRFLIGSLEYSANTRTWEIPEELPFIRAGKTIADYVKP